MWSPTIKKAEIKFQFNCKARRWVFQRAGDCGCIFHFCGRSKVPLKKWEITENQLRPISHASESKLAVFMVAGS